MINNVQQVAWSVKQATIYEKTTSTSHQSGASSELRTHNFVQSESGPCRQCECKRKFKRASECVTICTHEEIELQYFNQWKGHSVVKKTPNMEFVLRPVL